MSQQSEIWQISVREIFIASFTHIASYRLYEWIHNCILLINISSNLFLPAISVTTCINNFNCIFLININFKYFILTRNICYFVLLVCIQWNKYNISGKDSTASNPTSAEERAVLIFLLVCIQIWHIIFQVKIAQHQTRLRLRKGRSWFFC